MPKMTDSRRKKIQAKQRQARAARRRKKKAARREQRSAKTGGITGSPQADTRRLDPTLRHKVIVGRAQFCACTRCRRAGHVESHGTVWISDPISRFCRKSEAPSLSARLDKNLKDRT
jgi:hypothetical protein